MSISGLEYGQLQSILIYGTGSFILFVMSLYAVVVYQMYNLYQDRQNVPLYTSLMKIFYFYFAIAVFSMVFFAILVTFNHSKTANPAVGVYGFYLLDWQDVSNAIQAVKSSPAYLQAPSGEKATLEGIALGISGIKILYTILIISTFSLVPIFAFLLPYKQCTGQIMEYGGNGLTCIFGSFLTAVLYSSAFYLLLYFSQAAMNYVISYAKKNNYAIQTIQPDINHLDTMKKLMLKVKSEASQLISLGGSGGAVTKSLATATTTSAATRGGILRQPSSQPTQIQPSSIASSSIATSHSTPAPSYVQTIGGSGGYAKHSTATPCAKIEGGSIFPGVCASSSSSSTSSISSAFFGFF